MVLLLEATLEEQRHVYLVMSITTTTRKKVRVDQKIRLPGAREHKEQTEHGNKIVRAAGELFLARGFEGVSLEMIVAKTGGSFRDLYREFGSKEALFLRVLFDLCDEVIAPLQAMGVRESDEYSLEDVLSSMGKHVLETLLSTRLLELHRLVLSEAKRFPALATRWYESGPNTANRVIAAVLSRYDEVGLLRTHDPCTLAATFLDSLVNNLQLRSLTGMPVSEDDIDQKVALCVQIFLDGIRERHGNSFTQRNGEDA